MRYLTLAQYQLCADGINTANMSTISLAMFIQRAESDIDAFMGFDLNQQGGGFDPHTVWLQSRFDDQTRKVSAPNSIVPVRQIFRYRIQISNLTSAGAGFFANIQPTDCAINVTEGYIEIVPLQSVTYSLAPVLMQLGLRPPIVQVDCEVGFWIPHFKDTLYPAGGGTSVYTATRGFWASAYTQSLATQPNTLPPIPPIIYVNGIVQNPATYTINYTEGQVVFNSALAGNPTVQADYTAQIPDNVVSAVISRTTYLIGQANLNKSGLAGLEMIKTGDQMVSRGREHIIQGIYGSLDRESAGYLAPYIPIAVA